MPGIGNVTISKGRPFTSSIYFNRSPFHHDARFEPRHLQQTFQVRRYVIVLLQFFVLVSPGVKNPIVVSEAIFVVKKKVGSVVANPGINGPDLMDADILSSGESKTAAYRRFRLFVVH